MRFESVRAHAFGPFRNESLHLSPGMNVIYGPNEAGKSSWHAALYAGLCGMRRGRGQPLKDDKEFADRHRPWDDASSLWDVGVVVSLANGRRVELRHDLVSRTGKAQDDDLAGRDYSHEISYDGAPDGSHWIGLNRKTFLSTACVRQSDLLGLLEDPASLQRDLQRAAASAGSADTTAAAALQRLNDYRREFVGSDRASSKRPLRSTAAAVTSTRSALDGARSQHADYLRRLQEIDALESNADGAQSRVDAARAVLAQREADAAHHRMERARELNSLFPDGPPRPSSERDERAEKVTAALTTWNDRPSLDHLPGDTAEELQAQITDSDSRITAQRAAVAEREANDAHLRMERAKNLHALFPEGSPYFTDRDRQREQAVMSALLAWETLPLLQEPVGPSVEDLERELAGLDSWKTASPVGWQPRMLVRMLPSVFLIGTGAIAALLVPEYRVLGLVAAALGLVSGLVLGVLMLLGLRKRSTSAAEEAAFVARRNATLERLEARVVQQNRYDADRIRYEEILLSLKKAAEACGIDTNDPEAQAQELRHWQDAGEAAEHERVSRAVQWDDLQGLLAGQSLAEVAAEAERFRRRADGLIATVDPSLLNDARKSGVTAEQLVDLEHEAVEERSALEERRGKRLAAEEQHRKDAAIVAVAVDGLRSAAISVSVPTHDEPDALAEALVAWQDRRKANIAESQQRSEQWDELQQLLGERSIPELATLAKRLQAEAEAKIARLLGEPVGAQALAAARESDFAADELASLDEDARVAREEFTSKRGELTSHARTLPSVADAEDAFDAAEREHDRIVRLDATLAKAIDFLEKARDRAHRTIAPELRSTVLEWLPHVTKGRYTDCRVDPASLQVDVSGVDGHRYPAGLLSHGTAEQVYLLLRLAMARHMTAEGEVCPLILDDVVSASDAERKRAVLETLLAISESTQVVLFTHESDVCAWADERLAEPHNRLIKIAPPGVPA